MKTVLTVPAEIVGQLRQGLQLELGGAAHEITEGARVLREFVTGVGAEVSALAARPTAPATGLAAEGYLEMEEVGPSGPSTAPNFVSGLVPDGVSEVTIHQEDGNSVTVHVQENVYMKSVAGHISSVTFAGPNGPMTVGP